MICTLAPSDTLKAVMGGAATTTNPTYFVQVDDNRGENSPIGSLNGTTTVTMATGPAYGSLHIAKLTLNNADTISQTVTVNQVVGGTTYQRAAFTLSAGDVLTWDDGGIRVVDSSGRSRTVPSSQTSIRQLGRGGAAKAGTTAGWTVNAGNNLGTIATVAASQTSSTLVVAVPNLRVGDTITGFTVYSSINSAGGTVTLDAALRSLTIAAGATATDAAIASITQVSVTAATASTAAKTGLSTVVAAGVSYYLLLTATTAGSTTIELDQIEINTTSG